MFVESQILRSFRLWRTCARNQSKASCGGGGGSQKKGLILGAYDGCNPGEFRLTAASKVFDDSTGGQLEELLRGTGVPLGEVQVFGNLGQDYYAVAVAGVGQEGVGYDDYERLDHCKENIRIASGLAARSLQDQGINSIFLEPFTSMEAAIEGATLATWRYQDLKKPENQEINSKLEPFQSSDHDGWTRGITKGNCQNIARRLEDIPANLMTPTVFADNAIDILCPCGVQVDVRDRDWIEQQRMNAFTVIAKSSCEPPIFLEIGYCGGPPNDNPVIMVGKGITYDSGGLCLKPCDKMSEYRGDLAGAAVIVGVMRCIAALHLPINVIGLIPMCESMIGGMATKPGDVVMASNGKSIRIEDPDNEGRVVLADALSYSERLAPCAIISIATLTPGMRHTCGSGCSGVFITSDDMWREMERAGGETGDRFWRFPSFWRRYSEAVTNYVGVDVNNVGHGKTGHACLAAAFLKEFTPKNKDFAHIDITGTGMLASGVGIPYLREGTMTGRPVRTLSQFLYQTACPHDKGEEC